MCLYVRVASHAALSVPCATMHGTTSAVLVSGCMYMHVYVCAYLCVCVCVRSTLWSAQDQQREVCSTRGVAQYVRPRPDMVAKTVMEAAGF